MFAVTDAGRPGVWMMKEPLAEQPAIRVFGARQHNLRNIDVVIPRGTLTVITGVSGSGKSTLAFDTIHAEGRRKYVESLSTHARQFLEQMQRPDVDRIEGLSPTIAVEQRSSQAGPRSTVATTTEIHDYLRVLFARAGVPTCWKCARTITKQTTSQMVDAVLAEPAGRRILILAPLVVEQRGSHKSVLEKAVRDGFVRVRIDGEVAMIDEIAPLAANRKHTIEVVVDRLTVKPEIRERLADGIELATRQSGGRVVIAVEENDDRWVDRAYSAALACPDHPDVRVPELTPQLFSFNAPTGACQQCHGLGTTLEFDPDLIVPDSSRSLRDGAIAAWRRQGRTLNAEYAKKIQDFCDRFGVPPDTPYRNIPQSAAGILMHGTTDADAARFGGPFEGVLPDLRRRWETTGSESAREKLHAFLGESPCEACGGARLNRAALCSKIDGRSIADVSQMTIREAAAFFTDLHFQGEAVVVAEPLVREITQRLHFLCDVGVDYLALDRSSITLSGGEFQRIRLATQIGGGLAGVCYVLDEPTVGLHPRDTRRLTDILKQLATPDNTVIVVEHDEEVIRSATYMIDIGPGAGARGGRLVAQGTIEDVTRHPESITGRFLRGESVIVAPDQPRAPDWSQSIELHGVSANNLKNIDVRIPLGCFVAVTGVSGSGKSTLVNQVLLRALRRRLTGSGPRPAPFSELRGGELLDRIIEVDQSPIGRTPRSNPATYVGVFNLIRALFAKTREAKIRGYGPQRFSFNIKGGRCDLCEGQGVKRISMHFLPDVHVTCSECGGARYNRETLEIRYRGKNIADVLDMSAEEATRFFENFSNIARRVQALRDVGLGYMTLGQSSVTLSGGEAQRVKLAAELHASPDTRTLYVLDEPTTGLHPADVRNLLALLHRLVDRGHAVIVIEHNLDVIASADWIIDLGPEGGDAGGRIVTEGAPAHVAGHPTSHTGRYLSRRQRNQ